MPPLVPRKRLRQTPPPTDATSAKQSKSTPNGTATYERRKPTLYDDLDATAGDHSNSLLSALGGDDDDGSSLSTHSDDEFEDVPIAKRRKLQAEEEDEEDEDIEFEDVKAPEKDANVEHIPTVDLELTLTRDTRVSLANPYGEKKGPTKRERRVRYATHCVHLQMLLWHNAIRNAWCCNEEVQAILLSHMTPKLWEQFDRWRRSSGLEKVPPIPVKKPGPKVKGRGKGRNKVKKEEAEDHRDWGEEAEKLEEGAVDMSHGDPLYRLMQYLAPWWRKRFRVEAPGLRKWGYMPLERLDRLTKAHRTDEYNATRFGERISNLEEFKVAARDCKGSRDVGEQLFTALLRGLGIECRLVANLQALGFGWGKYEEAEAELEKGEAGDANKTDKMKENGITNGKSTPKRGKPSTQENNKEGARSRSRVKSKSDRGPETLKTEVSDSDDDSVIELSHTTKIPSPARKFDTDLEYPHYWTEALSPVTKKYVPVEPITKLLVGTNRDLVESLEPRGAKADKARQIMAYVVGHNSDGTAKDVTVRYLKKQMMPGRTKGVRMPPEKVPIRGKNGKVKRYEMFDWFKTAMSPYMRGTRKYPVTEVDELEDSTDLKAAQPEKKLIKEGEETLQYYKQSAEFVLERHLKREEALKFSAQPVKTFTNKVKSNKPDPPENVYLRKDVLNVKSAETWHKQGRKPKHGEQPMKMVPYRAATLNKKRELLETERETGRKVLQGLFSWDQTEWIIPDPIKDGVIPKNAYGNIDLFAKHMLPAGGVHIPYKHAPKICRKLGIDHAEAVVDFEFGNRMAVPVISGVVIAEENEEVLMEELEKFEAERQRKEDEKRRKKAVAMWRRFMMGLRIWRRLGGKEEGVFGHSKGDGDGLDEIEDGKDGEAGQEAMAGGFLPEGYEEEEEEEEEVREAAGFFAVTNDDDEEEDGDGGLVMEEDGPPVGHVAELTSSGLASAPTAKVPTLDAENEAVDQKKPAVVPKTRDPPRGSKGRGTRNMGRTSRASRNKKVVKDSDENTEDDSSLSDISQNPTSEYFATGSQEVGEAEDYAAKDSIQAPKRSFDTEDEDPTSANARSRGRGRVRGRGRGQGARSAARPTRRAAQMTDSTPTRRSTRQRKTVIDDSDVYMDSQDGNEDSGEE